MNPSKSTKHYTTKHKCRL